MGKRNDRREAAFQVLKSISEDTNVDAGARISAAEKIIAHSSPGRND